MLAPTHNLGRLLDGLMRDHELTQVELADRLDYSQGWVSGVRTGVRTPSFDLVQALVDCFPELNEFEVYGLVRDARTEVLRGKVVGAIPGLLCRLMPSHAAAAA